MRVDYKLRFDRRAGKVKRVSRAQLRGQPLDPVCKRAKTTSGEYGAEDKRVFCYGMGDDNGFPLYMCRV